MSSSEESLSLSDKIAGVRAKKFLTSSLLDLTKKYSISVSNWDGEIEKILAAAARENFAGGGIQEVENQTKVFLRWLGYSPVDVTFSPDVRAGKILLGTSRLLKGDINDDEVLRVLLGSLIKGVASAVLGGDARISFLEGEPLPPRFVTAIQFEDATASIIPTEKAEAIGLGIPMVGKNIVSPILGKAVSDEVAMGLLIESAFGVLGEADPTVLSVYQKEISEVPLKVLYVAYKEAQGMSEDKFQDLANSIGERFATRVRETVPPDTAPNDLVKGLGLLPIESVNELFFYGKGLICRGNKEEITFCEFLSHVWSSYVSVMLGKEFVADEPMCSAAGSKLCIYSVHAAAN